MRIWWFLAGAGAVLLVLTYLTLTSIIVIAPLSKFLPGDPIEKKKLRIWEPWSLEEIKVLVDRGEIPYEVYEYARYLRIKDPETIFKYAGGRFYYVSKGHEEPLEGAYIKKINDTWYEYIIVGYDSWVGKEHYVFRVNITTEKRYPQTFDANYPSYFLYLGYESGTLTTRYKMETVTIPMWIHWYDVRDNPEDWRIMGRLAEQVREYVERHNMSRLEKYLFVSYELTPVALPKGTPRLDWIGKPIRFEYLDGDRIEEGWLNESDSYVKSFLFFRGGHCTVDALFNMYLLKALGIRADLLVLYIDSLLDWHAYVVIPAKDMFPDGKIPDVFKLAYLSGPLGEDYNVVIVEDSGAIDYGITDIGYTVYRMNVLNKMAHLTVLITPYDTQDLYRESVKTE
ncbi:hypothetical protein [Geoglobus sp.]